MARRQSVILFTLGAFAGLSTETVAVLVSKHSSSSSTLCEKTVSDNLSVAEINLWLIRGETMPPPPPEILDHNARFALCARDRLTFARQVPKNLFMEFVVPYRNVDEPVDDWRPHFFKSLYPAASQAQTLKEAAEIIYPRIWRNLGNNVSFQANCTPAIMAPMSETLRLGHASCTGCSILVVDAMRAVGIPARIVGTPEWNLPSGGNHNWVEVWTGEGIGWHFFDAAPADTVSWDSGWFMGGNVKSAVPGGMHGIYSPVWHGNVTSNYTITWRNPPVLLPAVERTSFYKQVAAAA